MKRTESREQAFILLFEKSFRDESMSDIIDSAIESRELSDDSYARECAEGASKRIDELDAAIESALTDWTLSRISRVALAIMRLAVYEMKYSDTVPVSVAIDEAVELSKKYGGADDSAFVNGVLGAIARGMER